MWHQCSWKCRRFCVSPLRTKCHCNPLHFKTAGAKEDTETPQETQARVPEKVEAAAAAESEMQFEIDASSGREDFAFDDCMGDGEDASNIAQSEACRASAGYS